MAVGRPDNLPVSGARPAGYEQLTALNTVKTATVPAGARWMEINIETQPVRIRWDGTDPTAAVGMLYPAGTTMLVDCRGLTVPPEFIETTASAKVNIQYWR